MYSSSIPARAVPKVESRISAQKRQRSKLPSFIVQSQNQIIASFLQVQEATRDKIDQSLRSLVERDRAEFFGLVRKIQIREKLTKEQTQVQQQIVQRSGLQRRRNEDKLQMRSRPSKKLKLSSHRPLIVFYRYQIVSLFSLLGRREDFMATLRIKKNDVQVPPLTCAEVQERLRKQIESKGRDKGRQNFNIISSDQLRSLKYKKKGQYTYTNPFKSKEQGSGSKQPDKDDEEEEEQNQQQACKRQEKIDYATWRRRNGVGRNQKVFIIKGGYQDMRKALLERGWFENEDVWSPFYDLKWATKIMDVDFYRLSAHQIVNHFNNNQGLTSKFGVARNLRTLIMGSNIDVDRFFPRCYDLGDQPDFENFVENFKIGFAETVVRRFLVQPDRYHNLELKMRIAIEVLERRIRNFSEIVDSVNNGDYPMITPQDWAILTETSELTEAQTLERLKPYRKDDSDINAEDYETILFQKFNVRIQQALEKLKQIDPQIDLNGYHNIWIVKPNYLSRGRGIRCFNNLFDIVDYCFNKDIQYVAQKYIENPLLIYERKFDIRQWVLIQDFNPPKIWFYEECYIRFCTESYSLENIYNRYIHLTNNSIQKHSSKFNQTEIPGNMWSMAEFANHIGEDRWKTIQERIKDIVVWSIKSCEGGISARRNSCELVGYDFMIDEQLNPWLIEINMSPAMDYSTQITKRLVKSVMQDTVKVIADNNRNRDTGMFKCIYRGEETAQFDKYKI